MLDAGNGARIFDSGALHSEANSEERNLFLARVSDGVNHSGDAAFAEAAGNEDAVHVAQESFGGGGRVNFFGFDPFDYDAMAIGQAAVTQSFAQTFVGVFELNVLSYHADAHFTLRMLERFEHGEPAGKIARRSLQMQQTKNLFVEAFGGERHGNFVNIADVGSRDDAGFRHVAKERDLGFQVGGELAIAATN